MKFLWRASPSSASAREKYLCTCAQAGLGVGSTGLPESASPRVSMRSQTMFVCVIKRCFVSRTGVLTPRAP